MISNPCRKTEVAAGGFTSLKWSCGFFDSRVGHNIMSGAFELINIAV